MGMTHRGPPSDDVHFRACAHSPRGLATRRAARCACPSVCPIEYPWRCVRRPWRAQPRGIAVARATRTRWGLRHSCRSRCGEWPCFDVLQLVANAVTGHTRQDPLALGDVGTNGRRWRAHGDHCLSCISRTAKVAVVSEAYVRSSIEFGHGTEGTRSVRLHVIRPLFFFAAPVGRCLPCPPGPSIFMRWASACRSCVRSRC